MCHVKERESRTTHDHVTSSSQSQRSIDSSRGINLVKWGTLMHLVTFWAEHIICEVVNMINLWGYIEMCEM